MGSCTNYDIPVNYTYFGGIFKICFCTYSFYFTLYNYCNKRFAYIEFIECIGLNYIMYAPNTSWCLGVGLFLVNDLQTPLKSYAMFWNEWKIVSRFLRFLTFGLWSILYSKYLESSKYFKQNSWQKMAIFFVPKDT